MASKTRAKEVRLAHFGLPYQHYTMIDITTLAIVLALTVAFCIPFIHSHRKKKNHEKSLVKQFMDKAAELHLVISTYDIWRRVYIIGLDKKQAKLLYIKFGTDTKIQSVDLANIKRVSISKVEREVVTGEGKEKVTEKLGLTFSSSVVADTYLEFYNDDESLGLMGEPVLTQKWHDLAKNSLGHASAIQHTTQKI
jgi:hypothetical protein